MLYLVRRATEAEDGNQVTCRDLGRAIEWAELLEEHAQRVYGLRSPRALESARELWAHICSGNVENGISLRTLYRRELSGLNGKDATAAAIEVLAEHGYVRKERVNAPGPPSFVLIVRPELVGAPPKTGRQNRQLGSGAK